MNCQHLLRVSARNARLLLVLLLFLASGCRSQGDPRLAPPDPADLEKIEKPWTKEKIEGHEKLWLVFANGRSGRMVGALLMTDEHGDYLTTVNDKSLHFPLADAELVAIDHTKLDLSAPPAQGVVGSLLAFWGGVFLFVPSIILILLLT